MKVGSFFSRKFYAKNITYKEMLILYCQADLLANLWVPFISGETIVGDCVDVFFFSTVQKLQHVWGYVVHTKSKMKKLS
jgi:hypothetical protein